MTKLRTPYSAVGVLAACAALASAAGASAATLTGTVVHASKSTHSIVVADGRGHLHAVHLSRTVAPGRTVTLSVHKLRNGTLAASSVRVGRHVRRARLRGRVSYVSRAKRAFVISVRGASLVVHLRRSARAASAAFVASADSMPTLGSEVTVTGQFDQSGDLTAEAVENDGQNSDLVDLDGTILSIDAAARTISITADDNDGLVGAAIVVHLPSSFDLSKYALGETLIVVASLNPDGSYTAVDTFANDSGEEANEADCQESEDPAGEAASGDESQGEGSCEPDPSEEETD